MHLEFSFEISAIFNRSLRAITTFRIKTGCRFQTVNRA